MRRWVLLAVSASLVAPSVASAEPPPTDVLDEGQPSQESGLDHAPTPPAPPPPEQPLAPPPSEPDRVQPAPVIASGPPPGEPGSTCFARSGCRPSLHCLRNVCVDEGTYAASRAWLASESSEGEAEGYVGGAVGFGLPVLVGGALGEGFQGALRLGVLYYGFQFQLEVSPGTTALVNVASEPLGLFEASGTAGYLIPMGPWASWILRVGGGGGALFGGGDALGFGEFRADVLGAAIRTSDHLTVEFNAPSYRLLILPDGGGLSMMWVTNVGLHYMF